jgi:hypothetical protein
LKDIILSRDQGGTLGVALRVHRIPLLLTGAQDVARRLRRAPLQPPRPWSPSLQMRMGLELPTRPGSDLIGLTVQLLGYRVMIREGHWMSPCGFTVSLYSWSLSRA